VAEKEPRIRVAAIVRRGQSLLLVRHEKKGRSYWLLPGGGVQLGESLEEALHRELMEEARLRVQVGPLALVNDTIDPGGSRHMVQLAFACEIVEGEPALGEDPRVVEVRFVPLDELAGLELRPDIAPELSVGLRTGFPDKPVYLGKRWLAGS
jgi:ADP-ribose pyrophosphatase YjhB (NUDIX family)